MKSDKPGKVGVRMLSSLTFLVETTETIDQSCSEK